MINFILIIVYFVCGLTGIILMIRPYAPIKKIYKIGALNLTLIIAYITNNIIYIIYFICFNKLWALININIFLYLLAFYILSYRPNFIINDSLIKNNKKFFYFHQKDKRWRDIKYGIETIGKTGCGLAVLAMIESILNPNTNPDEVRKWIVGKYPGIKGGTPLEVMIEYLTYIGVQFKSLRGDCDIKSELKHDNIICVLYQSNHKNQHYILLRDIIGNKAKIVDPDDFTKTVSTVKLDKLMRKVPKTENILFPYISINL